MLYKDHVIGVLLSGQCLAPDLLNNQDFYLSEQGVSYLNNLLNYCRIALSPTVLTKPPGSTGVSIAGLLQYIRSWIRYSHYHHSSA
jgi:hypothetical protein